MSGDAESEWVRGYETARALCLRHGVEPEMPESVTSAYESGFSWGVFDWLDANGLPHGRRAGRRPA